MDEEQFEGALVLAECAKFHRGRWDMVLLQVHSQNAELMVEAAAVVEQLSAEMVAAGRQLLGGMQEPMLTLSLALCATKRGTGGRVCGPDLQDNPNVDPLTAKRIMDKRRTAALSKFKQKVASLAAVAVRAGLMPAPADDLGDEDPTNPASAATAVHLASSSNLQFPYEPSSPDAAQRSGWGGAAAAAAEAAAVSEDWGLVRRSRSFSRSAPVTTAAAAAAVGISGFNVSEDTMDGCAGDQTRKRPQRAVQRQLQQLQQQPTRQHLHCRVKRHKSQQLLGSSASQEVCNRQGAASRTIARSARSVSPVLETYTDADWERWDAEQQDMMLQGMAGRGTDGHGMAGLSDVTDTGFGSASNQGAAWQQPELEQASGFGSAGFGDVYSQLPPAGLEGVAQQQQGGQNGAAAGTAGHTTMGADSSMMKPMQQQGAREADDASLMSEFGAPSSPTLADLLSMGSPAQSPKAKAGNGWVGAQLPNNAGHSSQNGRVFGQHSGAGPAAAGGLGTGSAAGGPLGQQAAGVLASTGGMQGAAQGALMQAGNSGRAQLQASGGINNAHMPVPPAHAALAEHLASLMSAEIAKEQQPHGSVYRTDSMHSAQQQAPLAGFRASPSACRDASGNSSGLMQSPHDNTGGPGSQVQMQQIQDRLADRLLQSQYVQSPSTQNYNSTWGLYGSSFQQQQLAAPWEAPAAGQGNPALLPQGSAQAGMEQGFMGMGAARAAAHVSTGNLGAAAPATHPPDTSSTFTSSSQDSRNCDGLQSMLMSALMHGGQHALLSPNGAMMHRRASPQELQRALMINRLQQQQLLQEMELQRSGVQDQRADTGGRTSPAFSEGRMGLSCTLNRSQSMPAGSAQANGMPAGHSMQAFMPVQAAGNSNSIVGFGGAFRNELGVRWNSAAVAAVPAGAGRPAMRASPVQNVRQPPGPAAPFVQRSLPLLDQQDQPVAATVQGLITFVTEVLRSSNGHVIAAVNSIVPVLATAQQEGYDIQAVLRRVKATLLDAHLQAQRAQLLGVLENAPDAMQQQAAQAAEELAAALRNLVRLARPAQLQPALSLPDVSTATYFPGPADGFAAGGASNAGLLSTASLGAGYGQPGLNGILGGNKGFARSNSEQSESQTAGMLTMQHPRGTATVHMPRQGGGAAVAGPLEWLEGGFRG